MEMTWIKQNMTISDISINDIQYVINNLYKKPRFRVKDNIIRIGKLLNCYGSYNGFLKDFTDFKDGDLTSLEILYEDTDLRDNLHYCFVGKYGYKRFFKRYISWVYEYYNSRTDLDFIRRILITLIKSHKYLYRYNYNTCIDLGLYFDRREFYNYKIEQLFINKDIDRLNLYTYTIDNSWKK